MLDKSVERFIKLVHGINGISPTIDEIGMHAAYSAASGLHAYQDKWVPQYLITKATLYLLAVMMCQALGRFI